MHHDLIVIGGGVAGLVAAATAARQGLHTLVIEGSGAGGQVSTVERIDNMPGLGPIAGYELGPRLQEEAEAAGAEFALASVSAIEVDGLERRVIAGNETWSARAVIIAAGSHRRALGVPGEERLRGRGVSHCASCDGPFFRGQRVCVVGGGDAALSEALVLAAQAREVVLVHRGAAFGAQRTLVERVQATPNIALRLSTTVEEILGDETVNALRLRGPQGVESFAAEGVFVYVGLGPNTGFLGGLLALDARGAVIVDASLQSSAVGIFAAGDLRAGSTRRLAGVADDGAAAAVSAARYVAAHAAS
jgi:thioredoxin reductase (NADPH)